MVDEIYLKLKKFTKFLVAINHSNEKIFQKFKTDYNPNLV
jgi:hypothetical protein